MCVCVVLALSDNTAATVFALLYAAQHVASQHVKDPPLSVYFVLFVATCVLMPAPMCWLMLVASGIGIFTYQLRLEASTLAIGVKLQVLANCQVVNARHMS